MTQLKIGHACLNTHPGINEAFKQMTSLLRYHYPGLLKHDNKLLSIITLYNSDIGYHCTVSFKHDITYISLSIINHALNIITPNQSSMKIYLYPESI